MLQYMCVDTPCVIKINTISLIINACLRELTVQYRERGIIFSFSLIAGQNFVRGIVRDKEKMRRELLLVSNVIKYYNRSPQLSNCIDHSLLPQFVSSCLPGCPAALKRCHESFPS